MKTELLVKMTYLDDPYDDINGYKTDTINLGDMMIESQEDFDRMLEEVRKAMNMSDTGNFAHYRDNEFKMHDVNGSVEVKLVYCLRIGNKLFELTEVFE